MELCGAQESLKDIRCGVVWSPRKSKGHKMWSCVEPKKVYGIRSGVVWSPRKSKGHKMWSCVEPKKV